MVPARRHFARRRGPDDVRSTTPRREGRPTKSRSPRATLRLQRPTARAGPTPHRVDLSRTRPSQRRSTTPTGHRLAPCFEIAGDVVRPRNRRTARAQSTGRKLSYTNIAFGLAPEEFAMSTLREIYCAALGYQVDATNLQRVLGRRGVLTPTGNTAPSGKSGGRPPALYRFTDSTLRVTDEFAALRPPN